MPVKTHFKIVFRGVFLTTPEEWSFSLKYTRAVPGDDDAAVTDIGQSAVTSAAAAYIGSTNFQSNVKLMEWRAYQIGTDNHMEAEPIQVFTDTDNIVGTGTARAYPTNTALCVTTEGPNRGHARFGRFYLPGPHAQLDSDRLIAVSWLDPMVTATVTFLKDVSDSIDFPLAQSSSLINISNDATSTSQIVRNIKIGRVLDHIDRRRSKMDEDYHASGTIDW